MQQKNKYTGARFSLESLYRALKIVSQVPFSALRPGNIAMFHIGRCGSSVLCDQLGQHPEIYWDGEVYRQMREGQLAELRLLSDPKLILRLRMLRAGQRFFGFEVKFLPYQHLRPDLANMSVFNYVDFLHRLGFEHFILLKRENHLRRLVSARIGTQTGQWRLSKNGEPTKHKVLLPLEPSPNDTPLLEKFEVIDNAYDDLAHALSDSHTLHLTYEDDILPDPKMGYRKVCDFVDVEPFDTSINLRKQNPFPLSELIENFNEVERALKGTSYEWMLHK